VPTIDCSARFGLWQVFAMTRSKDPSIEALLARLDLDKRGWMLIDC
jgi:hypothetical protein